MLSKLSNDNSYALNYDKARLDKRAISGLIDLNFDTNLEGEGADFEYVSRLNINESFMATADRSSHLSQRLLNYKAVWSKPKLHITNAKAVAFLTKKQFFISKKSRDLVGLAHDAAVGAILLKPEVPYYDSRGNKVTMFEATRQVKKVISETQPILVTRTVLSTLRIRAEDENSFSLINANFNKEKSVEQKAAPEGGFFVIKQKRYKVRNIIPLRSNYDRLNPLVSSSKSSYEDRPTLNSSLSFVNQLEFEPTKLYRALKKNRNREEAMSSQLSRRLMRTRKTLVLPAHANITLVTNSYDVVHS